MSLKVPQSAKELVPWAQELIHDCQASVKKRAQAGATWRSWYLLGSDSGVPATYNKCRTHIERLSSYLYSPVDVQFSIEVERSVAETWKEELAIAASTLSRDFHRRATDVVFGEAVVWGLVKGCSFIKQIWGHDGCEPWLIQPEMMGVLREDIDDLGRQEAFVHSTYLTPSMLERQLAGNSEKAKILNKVARDTTTDQTDEARDDMFKEIIIAGVNPVALSQTNNPAGGIVNWMNGAPYEMSSYVLATLVRVDELWVQDRDTQDYTTIQMVGDTVLEGDLRHINLCGIEGSHPFTRVCPNPITGNLWGRGELANLWLIQDSINKRMQGIDDVWRRQEDPSRAFIGFSGMTDEKVAKLNTPGGWLAESEPTGKIEDMKPQLPEAAFEELQQLFSMFDDAGGMTPTLTGHGESGVRAQGHAETLVRTSSPQLRDRALLVERQVEDAGHKQFEMLQAHDATAFQVKAAGGVGGMMAGVLGKMGMGGGQKKAFTLAQLPEDIFISVDSHSASPAFSEEAARLAFALNQRHAISEADLIRLTPVQHKDTLIAAAEAREAAQAKLLQEHPELIGKTGGKGR